MLKTPVTGKIQDIEFRVIYSGRRTLGISVLPNSSVIVRVPYRTSDKTISRLVQEKSSWIIKHRDSYRIQDNKRINRLYVNGERYFFRGIESVLKIEKSKKSFVRFHDSTIEIGLEKSDDAKAIKKLLYKGYKDEATATLPVILNRIIERYEDQMLKPTGLTIRTMKRRWGSCSNRGKITLSTELIKLPDLYIEYVVIHELCHLRHHNHGAGYYKLLSELFPEWRSVRKELRRYIQM
jgi:predicted metal-dependent hydrolase